MKNYVCKVFLVALTVLPALRAQDKGIAPEWDIGKTLAAIAAHADRLAPFLEKIHPQDWQAKGAPDAYVAQWKQSVTQTNAVAANARTLGGNPDKLAGELELLFRMDSLTRMLVSLGEGVRRYQNPAVADLLHGMVSEDDGNREKLQQYILDLATEQEQQFRVADSEAQRCRGFLAKQPGKEKK